MKITLQNLTMQSDFFILTEYPHMVYILLTDIPLEGIRIMKNLFFRYVHILHLQGGQLMTEKRSCACAKSTYRTEEEKKKLINRMKRVEGQIRGIIRMVENDAYCNDILTQSAAANAAINAFNKELLSTHIHTCVARDIREGKDETIDELVATMQKLMK